MINRNKKIIMILSLVLTIVLAISLTYAFFYYGKEGGTIKLETGSISINFENDVNYLTISDAYPKSDSTGMISTDYYDFTVSGSNGKYDDVMYEIQIEQLEGNTLAEEYVKVYLTDQEDNDLRVEPKSLIDLETSKYNKNRVIYSDYIYKENQEADYRLRVWVDEKYTKNVQETFNFKLILYAINDKYVSLYTMINDQAVMDNIKSDFVSSTTGIDFSKNSSTTNGQGVYKRAGTENDEYPILYYRGNVSNNNVIFADFCWKIVRTTDTGGVKLIYNGVPTNGTCNNTGTASQLVEKSSFNSSYNSPAYNGYMYGTVYTRNSGSPTSGAYFGNSFSYENGVYTLVDTSTTLDATHHYTCNKTTADGTCSTIRYYYYTSGSIYYYINIKDAKGVEEALNEMQTNSVNSSIKTVIDNWYKSDESKMTDYTDYLEDTIWCNDRRMNTNTNGWNPNGGSLSEYLYYAPYGRARQTYQPSLTCLKNDAFTVKETEIGNGNLDYPIALLTSDEIMLAGGSSSNNSSYYLYTGQDYWSASPYYFDSKYAYSFLVNSSGYLYDLHVTVTFGVRPSVSLVQGIGTERGTGTVGDPYIIKY